MAKKLYSEWTTTYKDLQSSLKDLHKAIGTRQKLADGFETSDKAQITSIRQYVRAQKALAKQAGIDGKSLERLLKQAKKSKDKKLEELAKQAHKICQDLSRSEGGYRLDDPEMDPKTPTQNVDQALKDWNKLNREAKLRPVNQILNVSKVPNHLSKIRTVSEKLGKVGTFQNQYKTNAKKAGQAIGERRKVMQGKLKLMSASLKKIQDDIKAESKRN